MFKKDARKKGATLMELTVVLAVLSIITTMVVTFSIFLGERTKATVKSNDLMQEVVSIKAVVEKWVNDLSENDAIFSIENSTTIVAETDGSKYYLTLNGNLLSANLFNNENLFCTINAFDTLAFNIQKNSGQTLFICRAFYSSENLVQYFSFTVNPFVGDVV